MLQKKVLCLFVTLSIALCILLASCDTGGGSGDGTGTDTGGGGWNYIGYASSEKDCAAMAAYTGYLFYFYNGQGVCYGQ